MGLAPYGEPVYKDQILEHLLDLKEDGSFRMDMSYFNYCQGLTMTSPKFHDLFGGPPRQPESRVDAARDGPGGVDPGRDRRDHAARWPGTSTQQTGMKNLVLAGGVALNCVGNGRILREGPFEQLWIQPAAGDAGGALGTALFIWHQLLENRADRQGPDGQKRLPPGAASSPTMRLRQVLEQAGAVYHAVRSDERTLRRRSPI